MQCGNYKLKMEGNPQNRQQEVSADEIGRLIQAVAHYCGISPTGSNTTTGKILKIIAVLEDIRQGIPVGRNMPSGTSLSTWTSSPLRLRIPPPPATWQLKWSWRTR